MIFSTILFALSANGAECPNNEYHKQNLITLNCAGDHGTKAVNLQNGETLSIAHFPPNARNVRIELDANHDLDLCMYDSTYNSCRKNAQRCVAGYHCSIIGAPGGTSNYD